MYKPIFLIFFVLVACTKEPAQQTIQAPAAITPVATANANQKSTDAVPEKANVEIVAAITQPVVQGIDCQTIDRIVADNIKANVQNDDELLLAFGACNQRKKGSNTDGLVVAVRSSDGRFFYGIVPKDAAAKANSACHVASAVAAGIISAGESDVTMTLYGPGGRACDQLYSMAVGNNPMLVIEPVGAIGTKEAQRVASKALTKLRVYDDYKHATADLEAAAQRLHHSFNGDVEGVKNWVDSHPNEAAAIANPMVAQFVIAQKYLPKLPSPKKIKREVDRVIDKL